MADDIGIPPVVTPFAAKLLAAPSAAAARTVLGISTSGGSGAGLPDGGASGDLLGKASAADQDVEWKDRVDGGYF